MRNLTFLKFIAIHYMLMRNSNGKARRSNTRDKAKYKTNKKVNNKSISK